MQDSRACSVYEHTAALFFLLIDNFPLLDCLVTWSLLTLTDADWTCWLAADARVRKLKHRFEHDSDSGHTVHQLYTAYKQYSGGRACCVYQLPNKSRHSRQQMLGKSRSRSTFTESFKKPPDGNMTNITKMPSRTWFAANWNCQWSCRSLRRARSAPGTRRSLWCFSNLQ